MSGCDEIDCIGRQMIVDTGNSGRMDRMRRIERIEEKHGRIGSDNEQIVSDGDLIPESIGRVMRNNVKQSQS